MIILSTIRAWRKIVFGNIHTRTFVHAAIGLTGTALAGFFLAAFALWYLNIQVVKPASSRCEDAQFVVERGMDAREIARNLETQGLIRDDVSFLAYLGLKGGSKKIQAGEYILATCLTPRDIANRLIRGETKNEIAVTIPEGFTLAEIETRFRELRFQVSLSNFRVGDYRGVYELLRDVPPGMSLEGFLFPDTYFFERNADGDEATRKMLDNFHGKITADLREEITVQGKSVYEILTMASLLEEEVRSFEDKKIVSGILWKRLAIGMPLQVDATITYLTEKRSTDVTFNDLQIDSPYNTYRKKGLPPGPITNPGIESIKAALYPQESDFLYYLSSSEGDTIFSKTLEEHNRAKAAYLTR